MNTNNAPVAAFIMTYLEESIFHAIEIHRVKLIFSCLQCVSTGAMNAKLF